MSNPRIVRRRTADLCCGIRVVLTAGREKHESRQVGAAGTQRRTDDVNLLPEKFAFLVVTRVYVCNLQAPTLYGSSGARALLG